MRKKTNIKYDTLKIPRPIVNMIDKQVKSKKFTSRTDYIKYLVRKGNEKW